MLALVGVIGVWCWGALHPGSHPFTVIGRDGLLIAAAMVAVRAAAAYRGRRPGGRAPAPARVPVATDPRAVVRERAEGAGGGSYLGTCRGSWVFADPEHGVLLLGPPRSGKTSGVVIPALLACPGACVSTSTKPDVLHATIRRAPQLGRGVAV